MRENFIICWLSYSLKINSGPFLQDSPFKLKNASWELPSEVWNTVDCIFENIFTPFPYSPYSLLLYCKVCMEILPSVISMPLTFKNV
jgi:hypothetical protein